MYKQLKDEYFGFVRQAGELDLQLKEMEVVEILLSSCKIPLFAGIESNFLSFQGCDFVHYTLFYINVSKMYIIYIIFDFCTLYIILSNMYII